MPGASHRSRASQPVTLAYRELRPGDFAYNPMLVNVGSIALCPTEEEAGWGSPDYAVFRLAKDAPFDAEYLLMSSRASRAARDRAREQEVPSGDACTSTACSASLCRFAESPKPGRH